MIKYSIVIRANIYSVNPLEPEQLQAARDGIGVVAAYIGHELLTKKYGIKISVDTQGKVKPSRVGLGKLDKLVELHLLALPLNTGIAESLGMSAIGSGVAWVDTSETSNNIFQRTVVHEVAHALGFVDPRSQQSDGNYHCTDKACVMNSFLTLEHRRTHQSILSTLRSKNVPHEELVCVHGQFDFCTGCKTDMWSRGDESVTSLRHRRVVLDGKVYG
jgi:hypothetical protein